MQHPEQNALLPRQEAQGEVLPNGGRSFERGQRDRVIETLRAKAALCGVTLHVLDNGHDGIDFMVSRWNLSRTLPTADAVEQFLQQIGRRHG